MKLKHFATGALTCALLNSPLSAASHCAASSQLVQKARTDFAALRALNMRPGVCTLRAKTYSCSWAFPGDAFAVAEAQAAQLVQCATGESEEPPLKLKRGETAIALERDLSMIVGAPRIDNGQWLVTMRIVQE